MSAYHRFRERSLSYGVMLVGACLCVFLHNFRLGRPVENYAGVGGNFLSRMKSTVSCSRERHVITTQTDGLSVCAEKEGGGLLWISNGHSRRVCLATRQAGSSARTAGYDL